MCCGQLADLTQGINLYCSNTKPRYPIIRALFLALALLLTSKHQLSAQTTQQPFDTSTLDALLAVARTPLQSTAPSRQPVAPVITPPVGPPAVDPSGGSKTCDLLLSELEDAVTALNDEFLGFKNSLERLRPEVSRVQDMLRQPGSDEYCNTQWKQRIEALSDNLGNLAVENLYDRAKELMSCAISKDPELQQLKRKAGERDDLVELQKLEPIEERLVKVDFRAQTLTEQTDALFREVDRYRQGSSNADKICAPLDF